MSNDEHLDSLLGAYALDAVEPDERAEVERYLARSSSARAELRRLQLAVDALAVSTAGEPSDDTSVDAALAAGWQRIRADLGAASGEPARPAPVLRLEPAGHRRRRVVPVLLAAAAALVLGLAVGVVLARDSEPTVTTEQLADAAFDDPSSREGVLAGTATDDVTVPVAIDADGAGYLDAGALPALPADRTYQLWSVTDDAVLSLAVLGPAPTIVGFPAGADVHTLAITDEVAPGVVASTQAPVVSGTVA